MNLNRKMLLSIMLIGLIVGGSYAVECAVKVQGARSARIVRVVNDDQAVAMLSAGVFKQLKQQESAFDKDTSDNSVDGPSLLFVIRSTGINDFQQVEVKGLQNEDVYKLERNQINNDIVFSFTKHQTVNLGNKKDRGRYLVQDVSEIRVR